jgi:tRNA 2-selenouridine synthase
MPPALLYANSPWSAPWSELIDVRSRAEYALDHIPGAINLPVLSNDERTQVGTIYKQSPFTARKLGAALVSRNIANHLETHFADKPKDYQPLIYCWRGGQRSGSLALVLSQIGWRITLLQGGYKTYRRLVQTQLEQLAGQLNYRVLGGMTGTGKTLVLQSLAEQGFQVLNLESLANHRGSLLGEEPDSPQPSQKYFESLLLQRLQQLNPAETIWVESESNKIGRVYLPQGLWTRMLTAPILEIQLPLSIRVEHLLAHYHHFVEQPEVLKTKLARLTSRHGHAKLQVWSEQIDRGAWSEFVSDLLQSHYDPSYTRALKHSFGQQGETQSLALPDLQQSTLLNLAKKLRQEL